MDMRNLFTMTLLAVALLLPVKAAAYDITVDGKTRIITVDKNGNSDEVPGDVNGDSFVDIGDIITMIDIILGNAEPVAVADVHCDGEITLSDVNAVVDIILDQ